MKNWKKVHHIAIEKAVENIAPFTMKEITSKKRTENLADWRNAVACCYHLNGFNLVESAKTVNKHHATMIHYLKRLHGDITDKKTSSYLQSIVSSINDEAVKISEGMKCNEVKIDSYFENLTNKTRSKIMAETQSRLWGCAPQEKNRIVGFLHLINEEK